MEYHELDMLNKLKFILVFLFSPFISFVHAADDTIQVDEGGLGFKVPNFSDILTFGIRAFFVVAGIMALFYLLMGALAWVMSGGNKENVEKAQQKIQQAIVGVILVAVVLAVVVTLEQVVFKQKVCFGLSCAVTIPALLQ